MTLIKNLWNRNGAWRDRIEFILIIAAITAAIIGWININNQATTISNLQTRLIVTTRNSVFQRIYTVSQRCELTKLDADFALQASIVIGEFAPKVVFPFNHLRDEFISSYNGCEKQLKKVELIYKQAPKS